MIEQLRRILLRRWIALLATSFTLIIAAEAARGYGVLPEFSLPVSGWMPAALFVLSAITSLALPLLYRALFANAHRERSTISADILYRYENNALLISMVTPWWTLIAILLNVAEPYVLGTLLLAMYAVYTQYPGNRRLEADARIFRVRA